MEHKAWTGSTSGMGFSMTVRFAGAIAEEPEIDAEDFLQVLDAEGALEAGLSETDIQDIDLSNRLQVTKAIEEARTLLKVHSRFFDWAVAQLLEHEVITDGQARQAWPELEGESGTLHDQ
jgi:hypothetical protein